MKVLIIGGAGYIGSVTTRLFLSHRAKVTVLDNLIFGGESLVDLLENPNFKFVYGDIRNKIDIQSAAKGKDAIINLAAIVGEPLCTQYPKLAYDTNYKAACITGDIAKKEGVKKYIFVSTCSNYGINNDNKEATETSKVNPLSLYAETKINAERYILKLTSDRFSTTVVRFATIFGVSPRMRFDLLVSEFVKEAFLFGKITVYKPEVFRPLVHITDAAMALFLLAITSQKIQGEIFNVGFGNYRKREIIDKIVACMPSVKVEPIDTAKDKRDYKVSFEKIRKTLGFRAKHSLEEGIEETMQVLKWGLFPNPNDSRYTNIQTSTK